MNGKLKKNVISLLISLIVIFASSAFAWAFNTSFNNVSVSRIYFETDKGTLSGLLYKPKTISDEHPGPAIVTAHGFCNTAEMQDATAIEMSRRGFVVLALDMYDHGHSKGNSGNSGTFYDFWPTSVYDAVKYMYAQDYVLKDERKNGLIAVSGHSMGGASSEMALYYDEANSTSAGYRMVCAGFTMGSDYSWPSKLEPSIDAGVAAAMFKGRTIGKVAGVYDECFFASDNPPVTNGSVYKKNYIDTKEGRIILEQNDPQTDTWYSCSDGGERIIYQPKETHPMNYVSMTTINHAIDFYQVAFSDVGEKLIDIPATNQIWVFKQLFEIVSCIALFVFIFQLVALLLKAPFLRQAAIEENLSYLPEQSQKNKLIMIGICAIAMLASALIYTKIFSAGEASKEISPMVRYLKASTINGLAIWGVISAVIFAAAMAVLYFLIYKKQNVNVKQYGMKITRRKLWISLLIAIITTTAVYSLVFVTDAIFHADFRIWLFAVKTFEFSMLNATWIYLPLFFINFFVNSALIVSLTTTQKLKGKKGYAIACAVTAGGMAAMLVMQYLWLVIGGIGLFPNQTFSFMLLTGYIPVLIISTCLTKFIFKRTGNIYLSSALNTLLFTIITLANTAVYLQG